MSYYVPGVEGESATGMGAVTGARNQALAQDVDRIVDFAMQLRPGQRQQYLRQVLDNIRPGLADWAKTRAGELERLGYYDRDAVRQAISEGLAQHFGMGWAPIVAAALPAVASAASDMISDKWGKKKKPSAPPAAPPPPRLPALPRERKPKGFFSGPVPLIAGGVLVLGLLAVLLLRKKPAAAPASNPRCRRRRRRR